MKDKNLCATPYCTNKKRKYRKICGSCEKRKWRKKYPVQAAFEALRNNAKRRKKIFTLTFEQFKEFCVSYNYIAGKGKKKESFTIDCIDPSKGYTFENIQVLTNSANAKKGTKILVYDWQNNYATVI